MKNLKLTLLLFSLCALITTQFTFAQDDAKTAQEKSKLKEQMARGSAEKEGLLLQELKTLHRQYESASEADRPAIEEKISKLKATYSREIKGIDDDSQSEKRAVQVLGQDYEIQDKTRKLQNSEESKASEATESLDFNLSEKEDFIKNAKLRLAKAKVELANDIENGTISEMDIKIRKNKIAQVEEKLMNHVASVYEASKRNKELSEIAKE